MLSKNKKNNQMDFMGLPGRSVYGPIKDFYLRNLLEGVVREKSNYTKMIESLDALKML